MYIRFIKRSRSISLFATAWRSLLVNSLSPRLNWACTSFLTIWKTAWRSFLILASWIPNGTCDDFGMNLFIKANVYFQIFCIYSYEKLFCCNQYLFWSFKRLIKQTNTSISDVLRLMGYKSRSQLYALKKNQLLQDYLVHYAGKARAAIKGSNKRFISKLHSFSSFISWGNN